MEINENAAQKKSSINIEILLYTHTYTQFCDCHNLLEY